MAKSRTLLNFIIQILLASLLCMGATSKIFAENYKIVPAQQNGSGLKILRSNVNADFYFQAEISKAGVSVKGKTNSLKNKWVWIMIKNSSGKVVSETNSAISQNGSYTAALTKTLNQNGTYSMDIDMSSKRYGMYYPIYYSIPMEIKAGNLAFKTPSVYSSNSQAVKDAAITDPSGYLQATADNNIKKKTHELIAGLNSPKQKVKAIHDWIAENIYYDWDAFRSGKIDGSLGSASAVFQSKRSVCQGYAELMTAMAREAGIPCRLVDGNAIWLTEGQTWENTDKTKVNHAWNEVFLDGRWVIMDVTWDSGNKYENGRFIKGEKTYKYYDPTLEFFSYDHEIINKPTQKPAAPTGFTVTITGTAANLTWNAVPGATSYNVYVSTLYSTYDVIVVKGTKVKISGLQSSTKHYFYVTAVNALGEGNPSPTITGTTGK